MTDLPLRLRPLRIKDVPALMVIEEQVFPLPWPASVYRSELQRKHSNSSYLALDLLTGERERKAVLVGYAGYWLLGDEAHLMTIAVAPEWQGRGLGEWLLLGVLDEMEGQGAALATLEVRVSNSAAQSLYERLGFQVVGRRRRYYTDTGEDALIMSTPLLDSPGMRSLRAQRRTLNQERLVDLFND